MGNNKYGLFFAPEREIEGINKNGHQQLNEVEITLLEYLNPYRFKSSVIPSSYQSHISIIPIETNVARRFDRRIRAY